MNMCKMIVISDSHGYSGFAKKAIEQEYPTGVRSMVNFKSCMKEDFLNNKKSL